MLRKAGLIFGFAAALAGCDRANQVGSIAAPTPFINPLPAPLAIPSPEPPASLNGSVKWTSIATSRALCKEITNQVGDSWPVRLAMASIGDVVRVDIWEGPPEWEAPAEFDGTRRGEMVTAVRNNRSPLVMSCPPNMTAAQTGGDLAMTITGKEVAGTYTEVYGTDRDRMTWYFEFRGTLE